MIPNSVTGDYLKLPRTGILILNTNTGSITDVNPFLVNMLGFPRKEFIGKNNLARGRL
jgi:PAS domain-containing protein